MYNWDNDLYINVLWTIIKGVAVMSTVLGYTALVIVAIVLICIAVSAMIYQWKEDKKLFMVILASVLALILAITGLILKGMGL